MNCYNGKVLRVNLSTQTITVEELNKDYVRDYLGARGLGVRMLMDEIDPQVDPLSPENKLIFAAGPLSGLKVSTGTRYNVVTKSPLNGFIARSNSGGKWGSMLKYAGWDVLILEGKAEKPVYIEIINDQVTIKDAAHLWGKTSQETVDILKGDDKEMSVLNIGPAGETGSLTASIMNDIDRAAGRSGVGTVMGSKNVKAISVKTEVKALPAFDEVKFKEVAIESAKTLRANPVAGEGLPLYGTAVLVNIINAVGSYPTRNWQESEQNHDDAEATSGETLREEYLTKQHYCHNCTIGCGRVVDRNGVNVGGPEYETIWCFAANCGVNDLAAVNEANYWCNELGLDTISTGCTIATAMELYQKGFITDADCEGEPLTWGNAKAIVTYTKRIGNGETELGKLMAQGSYRLAEHYGVPELSMTAKKLDMPAYDGRGIQGIGLNYATSNRGGCHVNGYTISPEILGQPVQMDRKVVEGKAEIVKIFQDLTAAIDASGMCLFTSFGLGAPEYAAILKAATGFDLDGDEVMKIGERIYNLERLFNQRAGMTAADDTLPPRLLKEAIQNEASKGMVTRLDEMLPEYYELRGWVDAFPTAEKLAELGIDC